jgi:hypothetical protein
VSPVDCVGPNSAASVSSSSEGNRAGSSSCAGQPLVVSYLPEPQLGPSAAAAGADGDRRTTEAIITPAAAVQVQLLEPQPGTLLVADRTYFFRVLASQCTCVAVGTQQCGWQVLQPIDATEADMQRSGCGNAAAADYMSGLAVFAGSVYLPRVSAIFVAVQDAGQQGQAAGTAAGQLGQDASGQSVVPVASSSASWEPFLGIRVLPPVSLLIIMVSRPCARHHQWLQLFCSRCTGTFLHATMPSLIRVIWS